MAVIVRTGFTREVKRGSAWALDPHAELSAYPRLSLVLVVDRLPLLLGLVHRLVD